MTDEIRRIRNTKYESKFDNPEYTKLKFFAGIFIMFALCGWLIVFYNMIENTTVDTLDNIYLFLTSSFCLAMSVAYVVMRSKMKKLDQYQEELIQCVYDSIEIINEYIEDQSQKSKCIEEDLKKITKQNEAIISMSNSILYLQFRHYICPTNEEFESLMDALQGKIEKMNLREDLYQKLHENYVTTPLGIYKIEDWMRNTGICSAMDYYELYEKIYTLHPIIKEMDRVPDLFINIIDSLDSYKS